MKNKITLIIITLMMVTPIFGAEIVSNTLTIIVNNDSITIYNPYRPTDNNTFFYLKNHYLISNSTNSSNATYSPSFYIPEQNFSFTDLFINNGTYKVLDIDLNSKLLDCIALSSQLNTSLINCQLATAQLGNITSQLTVCQLDRRDRDNTIKNLQADKDTLILKTTGNQNNGIIWGLVGVILTAVGFIIYIRSKKGEGVASRINKEFSPLGAT